ncbi:MAG: hypothetical protein FWH27_14975 [Planctomycetaceae bacterium]|nr:hypothetical protein [Planctomycetaceae bacterium]
MKSTTVILLAIAGCLLLLAGAFAVFFAHGGQVVLERPFESGRGGHTEITADENVIDAMVGLDFTFEPTPGLAAHFHGTGKLKFPIAAPWEDRDQCHLIGSLELKGKVLQAIPSSHYYTELTKEDFYDQLRREIQSRIAISDADFTFNFPEYDFGGSQPHQLKKPPKK